MTDSLPPALVLAAGLGTRLRPLTFCRAKAAVPVAGTPLIRRHLTRLAAQGVPEAVVNLHHRPETIAAAAGDGVALGCRVRYSWEPVVLGSAGGPRHAVPLLGSRFFLINGDTLCDVDLGALLEAHRARGAGVTLAVTTNPSPERYGGVRADPAGRVTGFASRGDPERPPLFVGVQIAEASVFETLQDGVPAASVGGLYDRLLTTPGRVRIHEVAGRFHDIGTPADYLTATRAIGAAGARGCLCRPAMPPGHLRPGRAVRPVGRCGRGRELPGDKLHSHRRSGPLRRYAARRASGPATRCHDRPAN